MSELGGGFEFDDGANGMGNWDGALGLGKVRNGLVVQVSSVSSSLCFFFVFCISGVCSVFLILCL